MWIKSVFESINIIRHNDIVGKAIPHVYDTITKNFFRSSYPYLFTSNLLQLPLVKYNTSCLSFTLTSGLSCGLIMKNALLT